MVLAGGAQAADTYHLIRTVELPKVTGWDYLRIDSAKRELFVSNNSGVIVFSIDRLREVGTIPSPPTWRGVGLIHGVAVANDLGYGFVSQELPPRVVTFRLSDLRVVRATRVAPGPDAIVYDPTTKRVFSIDGKVSGVHRVTVVDADSGRRIGEIELPGRPEYAVSDHAGSVFVNIASLDRIVRIDARTLQINAVWRMGACKDPSALAIDRSRHRLFAACGNHRLIWMSSRSGQVLGSIPIGGGTDAVRFDPKTREIFASSGIGTLTVAREVRNAHVTVVQQIKTGPNGRTMALDHTTHRVFIITARFGSPPKHPTKYNPHDYPSVLPGTVKLMVYGPRS